MIIMLLVSLSRHRGHDPPPGAREEAAPEAQQGARGGERHLREEVLRAT